MDNSLSATGKRSLSSPLVKEKKLLSSSKTSRAASEVAPECDEIVVVHNNGQENQQQPQPEAIAITELPLRTAEDSNIPDKVGFSFFLPKNGPLLFFYSQFGELNVVVNFLG